MSNADHQLVPGGPPTPVRPTHPFEPFTRDQIEQSIPARFGQQIRRRPDNLAVKHGDDALSYAALDVHASRIARAILALRGPHPEPVLLMLEQGVSLVACILAVLKAGKFYVPLDASFLAARIADVFDDCEPGLVLTDAPNRPLVSQALPGAVPVLQAEEIDPGVASEDPHLSIAPQASAYIYFTSGSTGRPKGVLDTHRNVLHNVMRYTNSLHIAADDRLTLLQGPSFSGAVSSLFGALLNGAAVFPFDVPRQGVHRIAPWLRREQITIYHSVPALFRQVAKSGESFPALRVIRLEGDQASVRDAQLYQNHFPRRWSPPPGSGSTRCRSPRTPR